MKSFLYLKNWEKWRRTYEGGDTFINTYLKRFSALETAEAFQDRRSVTYCPAFAKREINEIKNSIFHRMYDINRIGGSLSYQSAVQGQIGGVDLRGNTMNKFMGQLVLPELMVMGKVGVLIDMPELTGDTILENVTKRPFLSVVPAEEIHDWEYCATDEGLYLRELKLEGDRTYELTPEGVLYNQTTLLPLTRIPFVILELSNSLLCDIADYQIALLNLASSDVAYCLRANFPFYVEKYDPRSDTYQTFRKEETNVVVGTATGRRYTMAQPSFIHPSPEPLRVSMEKQEQMKKEMRALLDLAVTNVQGQHASAESKAADHVSLEDGLANIGLELEYGERLIAGFWAQFESSTPATIHYPKQYSRKSDRERLEEAKELETFVPKIPSFTFKRVLLQRIATALVGTATDQVTLDKIKNEIENSDFFTSDPVTLTQDLDNGLVSVELASKARGYPKGQVEQAKLDHAERIRRIQQAQTSAEGTLPSPHDRGVKDL